MSSTHGAPKISLLAFHAFHLLSHDCTTHALWLSPLVFGGTDSDKSSYSSRLSQLVNGNKLWESYPRDLIRVLWERLKFPTCLLPSRYPDCPHGSCPPERGMMKNVLRELEVGTGRQTQMSCDTLPGETWTTVYLSQIGALP